MEIVKCIVLAELLFISVERHSVRFNHANNATVTVDPAL